ncbi:MAG: type II secretion system protein GspK [Pseudomonadota bacterium]|nr:type II secretion system protein GspK [Pseudomonadota bacterium]
MNAWPITSSRPVGPEPAQHQSGLALIMAIMLVGFAIALVAGISLLGRYENSISQQVRDQAKMRHFLLSTEAVGIRTLKDDDIAVDSCDEAWAQGQMFEADEAFENATFRIAIEDAQANYNINRLVAFDNGEWVTRPLQVTAFTNYLNSALNINAGGQTTPVNEVAASLADWLDTDDIAQINGLERFDYAGHNVANQPITQIEEIYAHPFFEQQENRFGFQSSTVSVELAALAPSAAMNVNTAPDEVLASLELANALISQQQLSAITGLRSNDPITSLSQIDSLSVFRNTNKDDLAELKQQLAVASEYFVVYSQVEREDETIATLRTLVKREQNGTILILERRFGNPWPRKPFLNPSPC